MLLALGALAQSLPIFGVSRFGASVFGASSGTSPVSVPAMPSWALVITALALLLISFRIEKHKN